VGGTKLAGMDSLDQHVFDLERELDNIEIDEGGLLCGGRIDYEERRTDEKAHFKR
jgi:hypothetical protein